jgi:hypothetical protein
VIETKANGGERNESVPGNSTFGRGDPILVVEGILFISGICRFVHPTSAGSE